MKYRFYRTPVSSETGCKLTELYRRGQEAASAASALAEKLKAVEFEMNPSFAMGGIGILYFKRKPSARRWDAHVKENGWYLCVPNIATQAGLKVLKEIAALPVVKMEQVAEAFGIDVQKRHPDNRMLPMFFRVEEQYDYVKCDAPLDCPGLEETTEEEFEKALRYVQQDEGK